MITNQIKSITSKHQNIKTNVKIEGHVDESATVPVNSERASLYLILLLSKREGKRRGKMEKNRRKKREKEKGEVKQGKYKQNGEKHDHDEKKWKKESPNREKTGRLKDRREYKRKKEKRTTTKKGEYDAQKKAARFINSLLEL